MNKFAAVLTLLLLPAAVAAQGHGEGHGQMEQGMQHGQMQMQQGQGMGMGMMHGPAMMMAHPGPGMLLRMKGALELTEGQIADLESMHAEAHEEMQMHRQAAMEARRSAHQAMMGDDADMGAFQSALEEAAMHDVQAQVAMARVHMQAADLLTDQQKATWQTVMRAMHEMRGGEGMMMRGEERDHEGRGERMRERQQSG